MPRQGEQSFRLGGRNSCTSTIVTNFIGIPIYDARLHEANERLRDLSARINDSVVKFNDLATNNASIKRFNDLATNYNDLVMQPNEARAAKK